MAFPINAGIVSSGAVVNKMAAEPATAVSPAKAPLWNAQFAPNAADSSACVVTLTSAGRTLTDRRPTPSCAFSCPLTQAEANRNPTAAEWVRISTAATWCEKQPDEKRSGYPAWVRVPMAATSASFSATLTAGHNGFFVDAGIGRAAPALVSSIAYKQARAQLTYWQYCLWADQPS
ncbi:MAG: hypothetical protein ABSG03_21615 [Bryobacteraceae bacterium]